LQLFSLFGNTAQILLASAACKQAISKMGGTHSTTFCFLQRDPKSSLLPTHNTPRASACVCFAATELPSHIALFASSHISTCKKQELKDAFMF